MKMKTTTLILLAVLQLTAFALAEGLNRQDVDYCSYDSLEALMEDVGASSPDELASSLGIEPNDVSSIPSSISGCCCEQEGAVCGPTWLQHFFTCSEKRCDRDNCACFFPQNNCACDGNCARNNVGICRDECKPVELQSTHSCGGIGCKCCITCSGKCGKKSKCRRRCRSNELDIGSCHETDSCRCCRRGRTVLKCGARCGISGTCSQRCNRNLLRDYLQVSPVQGKQIMNPQSCPSSCPCCDLSMGGK